MRGNLLINKTHDIVLIVVSHTDDETLGMGGTIAKHVQSGDNVYAMSMTDGLSSRGSVSKKEINSRDVSSEQAAKILGFKWIRKGNFPDNQIDKVPLIEIIKFIEIVKDEIKPTIIYTHSAADLNIDHQIAYKATITACRPLKKSSVEKILSFEVLSSTDWAAFNNKSFQPNYFVNITNQIKDKIKSISFYKSELRKYPHSRSLKAIETLSRSRGTSAGFKFAEAFFIVRELEK